MVGQLNIENDHSLVDRIIYLTSLVSDPVAVDPMLDTLREITAKMQPTDPLSSDEYTKLHTLESNLKYYLVNDDPVRSFSVASLDENLYKYFSTRAKGRLPAKKQLLLVIGITLVSYSIAVIAGGFSLRGLLIMSPVGLTLLNFGIAWFFWSATKNYAQEIRTMYEYFSAGIIIRSIALVQFPVLLAIPSLRRLLFFHYVGFLPPFILMSIIFYYGMLLYAKRLKLSTRFMSVAAISIGSVLFTIVIFLASWDVIGQHALFFSISLLSFLLSAYISIPAGGLALTVARHITPRYARSMRLLALSQLLFSFGCICFATVLAVVAGPLTNLEIGLTALTFIPPEVLLLLSAYSAKRAVGEVENN